MQLTRKILCIEDDPDTSKLIAHILRRKGYEVILAIGGKAGIEAVRQHRPDLVLLDLMMPEVDGWEVFRHMKADPNLDGIPVIAVTAKSHSIDRVMALNIAKVNDYVTKPFLPDDLLRRVHNILNNDEDASS